MTKKRPSVIAIHEASHCAVALRLNWVVRQAGIHTRPIPLDDGTISLGHTVIRAPAGLRRVPKGLRRAIESELIRQKLIILAAGSIGQRLAYRRSRDGSGSDRRQAALLGATMCHATTGQTALERHAKEEAAALVRQNWPLICELAEAFDAGMIPGRRVKALTADFDLRPSQPSVPPIGGDVKREDTLRKPSRRDLEAAALLVTIASLAAGEAGTARIFDLALEVVALRRNIDLEAARSKMTALAAQEAARSAWRPIPNQNQDTQ